MSHTRHILSCQSLAEADSWTIKNGVSGIDLMETAGRTVATRVTQLYAPRHTQVLCGPGNNGGDGFVVARHLVKAGWKVDVYSMTAPNDLSGDARQAAQLWKGDTHLIDRFSFQDNALIVDALFGAGLTRPLEGSLAELARASHEHSGPIVSVDVPSGMSGDGWPVYEPVFRSDVCVTFHRLKPAHVLYPSRKLCGSIHLADIGIPAGWDNITTTQALHNDPSIWTDFALDQEIETHKHARGRVTIVSGGKGATAAARMTAHAALKAGSGLVTLLCPDEAIEEASASSLSVMTRPLNSDNPGQSVQSTKAHALAFGMGAGLTDKTRDTVLELLALSTPCVLDADGLSVFENDSELLFRAVHDRTVLTPHEGEFRRLFPELKAADSNKIDRVKSAAQRAGCTILLKGPDTVIATPDGQCVVNTHASPRLATAGAGDILAGIIAGFLGQGIDVMSSVCAGVWLHGDAGLRLLPGSTAEDLLMFIPDSLQSLMMKQRQHSAMRQLLESQA